MANWKAINGTILILLLSNVANADESAGHYDCWSTFDYDEKPLLKLWMPDVLDENDMGATYIDLHGNPAQAVYSLDGLEQRWLMASDPKLQIILDPDLTAGYYDFREGGPTNAESLYECRKIIKRTPAVSADVALGVPGGMRMAKGDYLPIVRVVPVYPARALSRGVEGYVDVDFTVTTTGTVRDPVVLFSTNNMFDRAATRAVLKFKYKPRVLDGVPVDVPNVKTRIAFKIEE